MAGSIRTPEGRGGLLRVAARGAGIVPLVAAGFLPAPAASQPLITTVAGNGSAVYNGDDLPGPGASLASPNGLALDAAGNLYIADQSHHRVRRLDAVTELITTVAG